MPEAADSESTTLFRAARGDPAAFEQIVHRHQAMVFSIAWHYLGNRDLAEDVAQEVFLLLHRRLDEIESAAHLVQWLRKVAVHRSIDETRRRRFQPLTGIDGLPEPADRSQPDDPLLRGLLARLLSRLPARSRMIVVLRYTEELDPTEIAELLRMPVGTVKSQLHRSLAVLRRRLERMHKGAFR